MTKKAVGIGLALAAVPLLTAASDWTRRVTLSTAGGYVMGNPAAPTRLVEYISYTCDHCARFTQASGTLRSNWVQRGVLSVEVRNAVRDKYDLAAALLARCGGTTRFYGNHNAIFANHDNWMARVTAHSKLPQNPGLKNEAQQLSEIGVATGLYALMQRRGFNKRQLDLCIADKTSRGAVLGMAEEAWTKLQIGGTPAFSINGKVLGDVHDWDALRARLPDPAVPGQTVSAPFLLSRPKV